MGAVLLGGAQGDQYDGLLCSHSTDGRGAEVVPTVRLFHGKNSFQRINCHICFIILPEKKKEKTFSGKRRF
jgi:hypothetical protein